MKGVVKRHPLTNEVVDGVAKHHPIVGSEMSQ